ncbi:MAG: aminotransferase class V-fold PLP-dependent enzyme [Leptospiraceae bacterium]|nr:aminotransferase class V-fold PLP-dependent enzyme [Leptospiraceae bacterium]
MTEGVKYFDYNATHPPFVDILRKIQEEYFSNFYNPSGATRFSLTRQGKIEETRSYLASLSGKNKSGFIFSSTGTEANHFLIGHLKHSRYNTGKIYVSPFEHSSLYGALEIHNLEPILIPTDRSGLVDLNFLETSLNRDPHPVTVLAVANETGIIQPYHEIWKMTETYGMPFLSDLMQAFGKIPIDYTYLDAFTFSGHKIGAGMGSAVTYIPEDWRSDFKLYIGGNQENGNRAGTENTMAIAALKEVSLLQESALTEKNSRLKSFQLKIESTLLENSALIIGENSPRLPSTSFALLPIDEVDFFMMGMEEKGIVVSTGSSCKSRVREPSMSLLNMGYSEEEALKAIRISTGYFTDPIEIQCLIEEIPRTLKALG